MHPKFGYLLASILIVSQSVLAENESVECNFITLTRAQRAAQTEAVEKRIPALLGPISKTMTPVPLDGVYVSDPAIQRKIMVQDVFARRTDNNAIEVLTRIMNCTDYPLQIIGRTSFMDEKQFPTEDPSAWQTLFVDPHSFATYKEVSIGADAVANYLIELRSNR